MDVQSLALLLKQTLEPGTRAEAEANLDKVSKIIGFAPGILQVTLVNLTSDLSEKYILSLKCCNTLVC